MKKTRIKPAYLLSAALLTFLLAVILKSAWVSDDAFISFRYIKNLFEGYGLRWNVTERVQAFTNPLYVFFMIPLYAVSKNMYLSAIVLSVALSVSAVIIGIFPKGRRSVPIFALAIVVLSISKSFIDYSTSGLENPLTFLILALFYREFLLKDKPYANKEFLKLCLIACMGALNRIDTVLLFAPALLYSFLKEFKAKKILLGVAGFAPLILWEIFSFVYYGSFIPNTAIAKLNNSTTLAHNLYTGFRYIISTYIYGDIVTATIIFAAIIAGIYLLFKKKYKYSLSSLSVLLYILYIMYIGGDFMVGRHLSAPFFLSVALFYYIGYDYLSRKHIKPKKIALAVSIACITMLILGSIPSTSPISSKLKYSYNKSSISVDIKTTPIDERKFYYNDAGLSYYIANSFANGYDPNRSVYMTGHQGRFLDSDEIKLQGVIGFMGYFAPNDVKFIDYYGLSDALLARIPAAPDQRVGHYERPIPEGYVESVRSGENLIENPYLKEYYDKVLIITQGKIFSRERFRTIMDMSLGKYDYLMDEYTKSDEYQAYLAEITSN